MTVFKVAMLSITGVMLILLMKSAGSKLTVCVSMGVSVIILVYISIKLSGVINQLQSLNKYIAIGNEYIGLLVKIIGITYVSEFAADICRDAGNSAIAGQIELFCKISVAAVSLPVVLVLFETVSKCVN